MNTDKLTFWVDWYTASRQLPDDLRLAWYDGLLDYAFKGVMPKAGGTAAECIAFQAVMLLRAPIAKSRMRCEFGALGGLVNSKLKANAEQNGSKTEANAKQNGSKTEANAKQDKDKDKEQDATTTAHTRETKTPTLKQFIGGAITAGIPEGFAEPFYRELVEAGWADKDGRHIANWRRYLKTSYADWQKKIHAARVGTAEKTLDDYPDA